MILSFHPCIDADVQVILGNKEPNDDISRLIRQASAVILPQACSRQLYRLASSGCPNVFPDYDMRYKYPGKTGQAELFREYGVAHPLTYIWKSAGDFRQYFLSKGTPHMMPFVMKADQGHEGHHVYLVRDAQSLEEGLHKLEVLERSESRGFITQDYIESGNRVLRVVVIGKSLISYWKIAQAPDEFVVSLSKGARVERNLWEGKQRRGREAVREFCTGTGVNLAAFDLVFPLGGQGDAPLFLEINYYFGRRGLGGSDEYYRLLFEEVKNWVEERGLDCSHVMLA